jgi:hypothetical protein
MATKIHSRTQAATSNPGGRQGLSACQRRPCRPDLCQLGVRSITTRASHGIIEQKIPFTAVAFLGLAAIALAPSPCAKADSLSGPASVMATLFRSMASLYGPWRSTCRQGDDV